MAIRRERPREPDSRPGSFSVLDRIARRHDEDGRLRLLVERAQAGDDLAFGEVYITLYEPVRRWLEIAIKDRDEAHDAAQLVFERALRGLARYTDRTDSCFRAWVFSIARNLALDHLRSAARRTASTDPSVLTEQSDRLERQVADAASRMEDRGGVAALIEDLPSRQRTVLMLRFVSDFRTADIADLLGMSADAVRHTQHRALLSLGRSLMGTLA